MWDERIGSARVQARNWRLVALGGLFLSGMLVAGLLWQSARSRIVPYIVEVDRLGEARSVAPAVRDYRPTDGQVAWHLARFIANVRSVSLDPVLMRQNWLSAYDFASGQGALFLDEYARSAAPFSQVGQRTVSVQVTSVVRASDRSFQLKWTETQYVRGNPAGNSRWTAILTVEVKPPANADALRRNPLGLHVEAIDWSKELDSSETMPARSPAPPAIPDPEPLVPSAADPAGAAQPLEE
jgi:type IV secretion system protein VirB5